MLVGSPSAPVLLLGTDAVLNAMKLHPRDEDVQRSAAKTLAAMRQPLGIAAEEGLEVRLPHSLRRTAVNMRLQLRSRVLIVTALPLSGVLRCEYQCAGVCRAVATFE